MEAELLDLVDSGKEKKIRNVTSQTSQPLIIRILTREEGLEKKTNNSKMFTFLVHNETES